MTYLVYLNNESYVIKGEEAAFAAYNSARIFAYMAGGIPVLLVDAETGEIVTDNSDD